MKTLLIALKPFALVALLTINACHKPAQMSPEVKGPPPVVPQGKFALKGFYLGMPIDDVKKMDGVFCFNYKQGCLADVGCSINKWTVAGTDAEAVYFFVKGDKIQQIIVTFDSSKMVGVVAAFGLEYGPSSSTKQTTVKNRFGASFDQSVFRWVIKDAKVEISTRYQTVTEGALVIEPLKPDKQLTECTEKALASAQTDL